MDLGSGIFLRSGKCIYHHFFGAAYVSTVKVGLALEWDGICTHNEYICIAWAHQRKQKYAIGKVILEAYIILSCMCSQA
jgi:hypothetical protein